MISSNQPTDFDEYSWTDLVQKLRDVNQLFSIDKRLSMIQHLYSQYKSNEKQGKCEVQHGNSK